MRISDWSSDVCSSDLRFSSGLLGGRSLLGGGGLLGCRSLLRGRGLLRSSLLRGGRLLGRGLLGGLLGATGGASHRGGVGSLGLLRVGVQGTSYLVWLWKGMSADAARSEERTCRTEC